MVSRLCLGTLTVSPLQLDLAPQAAARLFAEALAAGVNFFDTADLYRTYPHLALLLRSARRREDVVIASKTYAVTAEEARADVHRAVRELATDYVDVFLLHEQESALTLRGHRAALEALAEMRSQGLVRAIGLSTHTVAGVRAAWLEPLIDVVHPIVNLAGLGIAGGGLPQMLAAVKDAAAAGKGIYAMKPLGGGHLAARAEEALAFVRDIPYIHSVALGIGGSQELRFAAAVFGGRQVSSELARKVAAQPRRLLVEPWCEGCGSCVRACGQGALRLEMGRAVADMDRCIFCGYCAAACPGFHIKVVSSDRAHDGR